MMRKGQTATEYLIILAVVIVIALIVVGVLGGIPGIGSSGQSKASAAYWSTLDPIAVSSFSNSVANGVAVVVRNNGKNAYTLSEFRLGTAGVGPAAVYSTDTALAIGAEAKLETLPAALPANIVCATMGEGFTYDVEIEYTDQTTSATYVFKGTQKLEGSCAQ